MKQALALLVNDIHCSKDNIEEFKKNWDEVVDVALEYGVEDIIVGGDMFTSQSSQTLPVLLAVKSALELATNNKLYVTLANGNHDKPNKDAEEGYCNVFMGMSGVEVIRDRSIIAWDDCDYTMVVIPYFSEDTFTSVLNELENNAERIAGYKKENTILYLHQGIQGALGMEVPGELPRELFEGYRAVLCGHYHDRMRIPGTDIYYIGASRQHNFGEDPAKGYTIFYDDGTWSYVDNKVNTRYMTYEIDGKDADSFSFEPKEGYKYRLKVNCTEKQAKDFDKQKFMDMGFNKVEVKAEVKKQVEFVASDIDEKYDKAGITKEYQNFCNEKDIDATLGVEYLNKID